MRELGIPLALSIGGLGVPEKGEDAQETYPHKHGCPMSKVGIPLALSIGGLGVPEKGGDVQETYPLYMDVP